MDISRSDRLRMERAHVAAWPASRTEVIDGWLWRSSGGGSQRANSVSTVDFTGDDPARAIAAAEARYAAIGMPARFQVFDETTPPGLEPLLRARGYRQTEATVTMFRCISPFEAAIDVEDRDIAWDAWLDVYLQEITPDRRAVNTAILGRVPQPRRFFGATRNGKVVSTALCVVSHRCAVIECVATASGARRQGAARRTLTALAQWAATQDADLLGLQVVATNHAAVTLYQDIGFTARATNRFWVAG